VLHIARVSKWLRYAFSALSFGLYLPFFIDLVSKAEKSLNWSIIIITISSLSVLEITLQIFSQLWFKSKNCGKKQIFTYRYILYFVCLVSVLSSVYSGVNGILVSDNSVSKLVTNNQDQTSKLNDSYSKQIESENNKIASNLKIIESNNKIIDSYKGIALMPKAQKQITSIQTKNERLLSENERLNESIKLIRTNLEKDKSLNEIFLNKQVDTSDTSRLVFAIIFAIIGIFSILGVNYCNNIFYKWVHLAWIDLNTEIILKKHENEILQEMERAKLSEKKQIRTDSENNSKTFEKTVRTDLDEKKEDKKNEYDNLFDQPHPTNDEKKKIN